jgi:1,4-dihydroxy-2-naphthoyl-CoA synthase
MVGTKWKISMAIKMLKFAMNLTDDGMVGQQVLREKLLV